MISNYLMGTGILYNKHKTEQHYSIDLKSMAENTNQITELKKLIQEELKNCNRFLWPKVCEMQSTEKGLERLQEMIIRYVAEEGMPIGSAIAIIEQDLSHIL